ncbi:MAG: MBL fold metallo-hydrolase [Bacteroidales bacterium]|nr:MBL fold metallo-hydrolase [Bacteroidales bacterium]
MKIKFIGATREVTGSKHIVITDSGKKILLDCGMFQGKGMETDAANRNLGFEPSEIDYILVTHAHIDHTGLIPYVYKNGFNGRVICTEATKDLCSIMLPDSGFIQELDIKWYNKKLFKQGLPRVNPIYTHSDAEQCLKIFTAVAYDYDYELEEGLVVRFTNSGHMLGSAVVNLSVTENGKTTNIAYTGDVGRPHNKIVKPPVAFPQADILITEATYGNRIHQADHETEVELYNVIKHTCVEKRGKLIIPSFSVGRTQEIVYMLNNFYNIGLLPKIDIYVDSPLSVNATEIFKKHHECYNDEIVKSLENDPEPFDFDTLHYVKSINESKELNTTKKPCIIISASGMAEAGRVKHHIANSIENSCNTIMLVGYCAPETLGARIQEKDRVDISIFGMVHPLNADVERIESLSGHGDYIEMEEFISCQNKDELRNIFLVHGDYSAQKYYREYLMSKGYKNIEIPERGDEFFY